MDLADDTITALTAEVFSATLGLGVHANGGSDLDRASALVLTSCVQLTGDWCGALTLDFPVELARIAAGRMFDTPPEELPESDVHDALGELANVLGGNLKALVPGSCQLSLPAVAEGSGHHFSIPRSVVRAGLALTCEGHPLHVTVLEREQSRGSNT